MTATDSRNSESIILRRLADVSQADAARATGISESRLSRWKNNEANGGGLSLTETSAVLAALGLHPVLVGADAVTIPAAEYEALRLLARKGLDAAP